MTPEEMYFRRGVVCLSGLLYWAGVLIQGRRIRKRIGRSPNLRPRGSREKALWFGWFMVVLVWIGQPLLIGAKRSLPGLNIFPGLLNGVGLVSGLFLIILGYTGTLWAYAAMGDTWRIGINGREKTTLIRRGPYRWIRHPIYLLQVVMLAGAALLIPTPVSFAALAAHYVCAVIKAHDEEKHLDAVHGAAYREYISNTIGFAPSARRTKANSD